MAMRREVLERQLSVATTLRDERVKHLSGQGKSEAEYRKDAKWRQANSTCRSLTRRLRRVAEKREQVQESDSDD
ncbi:MAG: hypothetical protein KDA86_26575 [Planctomycetaceae bacterium]|nr:hypothetical protein [Planctomycetaceae bacterium]